MLIENSPVEGSDVTPVIKIGVEQNHPAADGGMVRTNELHQNDDTQRISIIMQENSTVSEINDIICNIKVQNLDEF